MFNDPEIKESHGALPFHYAAKDTLWNPEVICVIYKSYQCFRAMRVCLYFTYA